MAAAYLDAGIQSRMNRIINPKDNRVVMFAIDHPYFQGPTTGLRNMSNTIKTLLPYCDCLMTTRGAVRSNIAAEDLGSKPIMLRVTGGNSILFEELSDEKITVSIREAIRMDAAGVAVSVSIGSANQQQTILNLTGMVNHAEEYGIPVLAVTAVGKNMARDLRYLALASRICQDAGARIIKTYYCEEFSRLVDAVAPTAVVVAGGKYSCPPDALQMAYNSVEAGAAGVDFGRNIFQDDNPVGMIRAIGAIVHGNHTVKEALDIYTACLPGASSSTKFFNVASMVLPENTMKAAIYYSNSDVRTEDVEDLPVGPGEIKVRVMACGVCGSDVMEWYRIRRAGRPGGIGAFGHECTGIIAETGSHVDPKWKAGDRVVVTHHVPCNTCNACIRGHATACDTLQRIKFKNGYGAFAEYVVLPGITVDRGVLRLPETVSFDAGTFVEPLGCVVRGQQCAPTSDGRAVLIIGAGITGLLHIQAARLNGAGLIAVSDTNPDRLELARKFGADATIPATEDVPGKFRELNGGLGADTVIMTAPVPVCVKQSLEAVGPGGTILFFAPTNPEIQSEINLWTLWQKEVTITHSYAADLHNLATALTWIQRGRINVTDMITHVLPLKDTAEGFLLTSRPRDGSLKVVIHPQE